MRRSTHRIIQSLAEWEHMLDAGRASRLQPAETGTGHAATYKSAGEESIAACASGKKCWKS